MQYKPTMVDDVMSLMFVAYYFIEHGLPWTDYIDIQMEKNPCVNLYEIKTFKQIRLRKDIQF